MNVSGIRPRTAGGLCGILLVAGLYGPFALGRLPGGPGVPGLVTLLVPGFVAAYLAARQGTLLAPLKEGALAGIVTGHMAAALQVFVVVAGALTVDWTQYAQQVGPEVAAGVQNAIVPLAVAAALLASLVTYAACVLLAWLGAAGYMALSGAAGKRNRSSSLGGERAGE